MGKLIYFSGDHIFHNIVVDRLNVVETATVTDGQYKLIWGSPGDLNGW